MQIITRLFRPESFQDGVIYLRAERCVSIDAIEFSFVKFKGYDPCPALVWVDKPDGQVERCPRDEIFLPAFTAGQSFIAQ